ncbi:MAG: DUF2812 domain-containing protein, partial [Firmicutes bacterium]|nr:DUF2812 domain-containing protein [Bacillota bacterium]
MRTIIHKFFGIWNYEKEEQWLNEMAAKGLCLVSVGYCRYEFEDCQPGEYTIRLQLLANNPTHPEGAKYIQFIEDTGAEHVASWLKWVYFRKKKSDGEFQLFSDHTSLIQHLTRVLHLLLILGIANLYIGAYNLFLFFFLDSGINILGFINFFIG